MFPYRLRLDAKRERDGVHQIKPRGEPFTVGEPACCSLLSSALTIPDDLQLSGVASGVTYLHEFGIVHGDLKGVLSNIHNQFFLSQ